VPTIESGILGLLAAGRRLSTWRGESFYNIKVLSRRMTNRAKCQRLGTALGDANCAAEKTNTRKPFL